MEVYGYDPFISVNAAWMLSRDVKHITSADTNYQECDYITIHVPATPDTKGMINQEKIAEMKDGVIILNFARDVLVNDADMAQALESGKVARYVTDFPNPSSVHMKNTIVITHLGASTEESEDNCAKMAVKELTDYLYLVFAETEVDKRNRNPGGAGGQHFRYDQQEPGPVRLHPAGFGGQTYAGDH